MHRGFVLVLSVGLVAGAAWGQSLGEIAERERQKKKEKPPPRPARVYTDDDLPRPTPTPEGASSKASQAPSSVDPGYSPPENPRREWQASAAAVRERVAQARKRLADAQAALDKLKSPYHVLHPYGHGNPEVPGAEQAVADAREGLTQAEAEQASFEKEAARARVPSRWLEPQ